MTERTPVAEGFFGLEVAEMFRTSGGTGPLADRLWPDFTIHHDDLLVEKTAPSAFFPGRCALPEMLRRIACVFPRRLLSFTLGGNMTSLCGLGNGLP